MNKNIVKWLNTNRYRNSIRSTILTCSVLCVDIVIVNRYVINNKLIGFKRIHKIQHSNWYNFVIFQKYVIILFELYFREEIVLSVLMGFILFIFVIVAIVSPFSIKLKAFKIEGYNIVLYTGVFNDALIIEDVLIESELDSMFHATYLDGELPNGTKVYARFCWGSMRLETKSFYSK